MSPCPKAVEVCTDGSILKATSYLMSAPEKTEVPEAQAEEAAAEEAKNWAAASGEQSVGSLGEGVQAEVLSESVPEPVEVEVAKYYSLTMGNELPGDSVLVSKVFWPDAGVGTKKSGVDAAGACVFLI